METVTGDTIQGGNIWLIIRSADKCVLSKTLNCSFFFYYAVDRTYVCTGCCLRIDRDLNAAHNIRNFIIASGRPDLR